ncbi:IS3 family transposase [Dehalogenimonas sp. 4OHTPN]|uniref:IS3 family transposase n=1 Tax=Dehalogenimonas sp. 4OHTPN TaxID=3166643 RepID=A0AAU8GBJ1_9CHLR
MKAKHYTEEQIIAVLKEGEAGAKVADLCRKYGVSEATYYNWKTKYAGLTVGELKRLKTLEEENRRLKQIVADQALDIRALTALKKLLKPKVKCLAVSHIRESLGLSERRACMLVDISSSVYRYQPKPDDDAQLRKRLRELAEQRKRFGSPRLHIMLKREGLVVNHKRTERIYREEGLALRKKRRRKGAAGARVVMPTAQGVNERWSMDFVTDSIVNGRRFRSLTIVDDYSRECPRIEVDTSLGGRRVVGVLDQLAEIRGLPEIITIDNGPEFAGKALDEWAYRHGVKLNFIRLGKPIENAYAESFNGRFRDECLNTNWFLSLKHAREVIEEWRRDYNEVRPHSSLKGFTPKEYAETTVGL